MTLTSEQREQLLRPLNRRRVHQNPKKFSYIEAYDVRAMLIRLFDFCGWSQEVLAMQLAFEDVERDRPVLKWDNDKKKKLPTGEVQDVWTVCYRAQVRLTIINDEGFSEATYTEWAAGSATNYPSRGDAHDNAIKTAESQAMKRCAVNLGDQFGLGLYNGGSLAPLVMQVIHHDMVAAAQGVDDHVDELAPEVEESTYVEDPPEPAPDPREHNVEPEPADKSAQVEAFVALVEQGPPEGTALVRWHAKLLARATAERLLNEEAPGGVTVKTFIDLARDSRKSAS